MKQLLLYSFIMAFLFTCSSCIRWTKYSPDIMQVKPVAKNTNLKIGLIIPLGKELVAFDGQSDPGDSRMWTWKEKYIADCQYPYKYLNMPTIVAEYFNIDPILIYVIGFNSIDAIGSNSNSISLDEIKKGALHPNGKLLMIHNLGTHISGQIIFTDKTGKTNPVFDNENLPRGYDYFIKFNSEKGGGIDVQLFLALLSLGFIPYSGASSDHFSLDLLDSKGHVIKQLNSTVTHHTFFWSLLLWVGPFFDNPTPISEGREIITRNLLQQLQQVLSAKTQSPTSSTNKASSETQMREVLSGYKIGVTTQKQCMDDITAGSWNMNLGSMGMEVLSGKVTLSMTVGVGGRDVCDLVFEGNNPQQTETGKTPDFGKFLLQEITFKP